MDSGGSKCPGSGLCCTAVWNAFCGEDCFKKACAAAGGAWIPLDYSRDQTHRQRDEYTCDLTVAQVTIAGYTFDHVGFWDGYTVLGTSTDDQECADLCDKTADCKGFSRQEKSGSTCYGYTATELNPRASTFDYAYRKVVT